MTDPTLKFPRWLPVCTVALGVAGFAVWALQGLLGNPGFALLFDRGTAHWIAPDHPTSLVAQERGPVTAMFSRVFAVERPVAKATLSVGAYRSVTVTLDGRVLHEEPSVLNAWKFERQIPLPDPLAPGVHVLLVTCSNDRGPPMVRVRCPEAGLYSNRDWSVAGPRGAPEPVRLASEIRSPAMALELPAVPDAFRQLLPWIALAAIAGALMAWFGKRLDDGLTPSRARWCAIAGLSVIGVHNLLRLPMEAGADVAYHYTYVHHLIAKHALPPITENLQAFEGPLFYLLAAALHSLLAIFISEEAVDRWLRLIPIVCSLGFCEVAYRQARVTFAENPRAQRLAILIAASMPVLLIKCLPVGNEPLAGVLAAATALGVFQLVSSPMPSIARFAAVGALWGLAVLAKVSALVLAGPLFVVFAWWIATDRTQWQPRLARLGAFGMAAAVICGWFFVRSQLLYGKPIVGGWDAAVGYEWWQFPGYRTPDQYLSFGSVLQHPSYALVHGLWDGLYGGLWFDIENSGVPNTRFGPTWHHTAAAAVLPWALLPTLALLFGAGRALWPSRYADERPRAISLWFALMVAGAYLAAIIGHSLALPYYNAIKTTYALGAMPSLVMLIVAAAEPLTQRRWGRLLIGAWLAPWLMLVFVAYWGR